ncbi:hypothetical protein BVRB_7g174650 [Beta vulgaris subsp. vulgaris]|uniref:pentatricopeptide repeat-containing protein At1g07740, mitochondrial n=1 Tax=Beta vulgaris subsp. vulgaris TaxID=3555 RepID=UPI00065C4919|nr:pentatricopeptide repeat-containing protein At1g07740, mitochondrial [Beta vulgaris subsp. vulgaris]KMT05330.1 hypothetical protein BVRB_7g174650 [Beta vulgaris subsp. vulgaris]
MLKLHPPRIPKTITTKSHFQTITSTSKAQTQTHNPPLKRRKAKLKPIPFLADLKQLQDPDEALSLFNQYTQSGFKHDYPSYSSLLYKLARSRKFEQIDPLLDFIKNRNIRCRESLFIGLIRHYGKCKLIEKAIELFNQMPKFNCERNLQSFNTLLNVLIDNDRRYDANDLFLRSRELGFRLNSVSYNIMMKGWLIKGDLENAWKVFDEMLEREVEPSVVTYNSLIGFLCKKGDVSKGVKLLDDMVRKGKRPNTVTYALLMEGLCSLGKYKEAKKMMFDMEYRGCKPRLVNFGVLMTYLAQRGELDEAKSFLLEMKKKRLKPDVVTYNILVNFLCKERRAEEAYKVLVDMQINGCEPNAATYRMLVDGFCRIGEYERGLGILHAMLMSRHCPRLESFCSLVTGLLSGGKMDDACFVLEEMEKRNMRFLPAKWESLVVEFCVAGDNTIDDLVSKSSSALP